jgi:tetratricopeptide (TPR) repeat protein
MFDFSHASVRRALSFLTVILLTGFIVGCGKKELTADEVLTEAGIVRSTGRLGEAIALLESYEQANPGNLAIIEALAFDYMDAGDPATAAMYFARVAEIDSSQAEYLIWAAEAWMTAGDPDTAITIYQQYLTVRPADQGTRLVLAELYSSRGQADAARDALLRINRDAPSGDIQVRIAKLFLEGRNLAQAQQWYDSAARFGDEARDEALLGLIEVAVRANRYADAEQIVAVLDEEFPEALDNSRLAAVRPQLVTWRATQAAVIDAAAQLTATPATPANSANRRGSEPTRPNTVTVDAAPTITIPTASPPANSVEPTAAIAADGPATALVEISPEDLPQPDKDEMIALAEQEEAAARAAENAANNAEAASETAPAEAVATTPRRLFPSSEPATVITAPAPPSLNYAGFVAAARAAAAQGRNAEAAKNYQRALARSSQDPQIWSELSEAQYLVGEVRLAVASASEAVRRTPTSAAFRLQYLRVLQGSASPVQMIEEMEKARRDFPRNASFTLVLARAHRDLGNTRFARRYFEEFLRIAPATHPDLAAAESELRAL